MMNQIRHLVETRGARKFFEASDHFAANREEAVEFCKLLSEYQEKYSLRLKITVQTRITDARYPALLEAMKQANINNICIGYESPIDEELLAMRKGYLSKDLIHWTNTFHEYGFFIHGMFIFGYPRRIDDAYQPIPLKERAERFMKFIKKAKIDTIQVLLTIPLPGTDLRKRLLREHRVFPIDQLGWEYYDGQYPLFIPDDDAEPEEMQRCVGKLMLEFYNFGNFWRIARNILIHFPVIVFTSAFTIIVGKVKYITLSYHIWHKRYFRNYSLRFGGYFIVKNWFKKFREDTFLERLTLAKEELDAKNKNSTSVKQ
jgi:radical SAM superfamily enzyme YgiQ (UPF0313 family)